MALDVLAVQAPLNPTLMVHLRGRAIGKVARLNVDSGGADHKHSSKAIQNTQSVYHVLRNGTQRITNPNANAAGNPKDTMPRKDRSV